MRLCTHLIPLKPKTKTNCWPIYTQQSFLFTPIWNLLSSLLTVIIIIMIIMRFGNEIGATAGCEDWRSWDSCEFASENVCVSFFMSRFGQQNKSQHLAYNLHYSEIVFCLFNSFFLSHFGSKLSPVDVCQSYVRVLKSCLI